MKKQRKSRGFERLLVSKRSADRPGHHLKITAVPQLTSCFMRRGHASPKTRNKTRVSTMPRPPKAARGAQLEILISNCKVIS